MSEIISAWFEEVKKLPIGRTLYVRAANKKEQTAIANEFEEERVEYAKIDAVHASQLFINKVLKDRNQYVTIERRYRAPFTGFIKDESGAFTKITIDPERVRIITLMIKDGRSREEVEETLNGLTEEEIDKFYPSQE